MATGPNLPYKLVHVEPSADGKTRAVTFISEHSTDAYVRQAVTVHAPKVPAVQVSSARAYFEAWVTSSVIPLGFAKPAAPTPPAPVPAPPTPTPPAPSPAAPAPAPSVDAALWLTKPPVEPKTPDRPARGVWINDPVFGTQLRRLTDDADVPGISFAKNDYSRRNPFSAGNVFQHVSRVDGWWHLYDAQGAKPIAKLPTLAGDAEPHWHPTNPDVLWHLSMNGTDMKVYERNVRTGTARVVGDLGARIKAKFPAADAASTKAEGAPSADGRYWAFQIEDTDRNWADLGVIVWDMQTDTVIATMSIPDGCDHVSMSPSGNYVVTSHVGGWGVRAYTRDLTSYKEVLSTSQHSDIVLGEDGDDYFVAADYGSKQDSDGGIFAFNLRTSVRRELFPMYRDSASTAYHFSGKAYERRGWVVVSTQAETANTWQWQWRKVFLVNVHTLERRPLFFHRSKYTGYNSAPVASISRDGSMVAFNSNWGSTNEGDTHVFQAKVTW